jgi:Fic family protein
MKIPLRPPPLRELIDSVLAGEHGPKRYAQIMLSGAGPAPGGKYRHWDTLRRIPSEDGSSPEERWLAVKLARHQLYQRLPILDRQGQPFVYALPGIALQMLHQIDRDASGNIRMPEQVTNPHTRDKYLISSLIEEAITSSQLEGASTARRVAKDMILEERKPRTRSEQMIHNNYQAMLFIRRFLGKPITPQTVLELQTILTEETLESPDATGRVRRPDEPIGVVDRLTGTLLHDPPRAEQLEERMQAMCRFANDAASSEFMHPVVRAVFLHFWLAYDHPFVDGNGRTARALFYWSMASQGYWLAEYISISSILRKAPTKYAQSFLYTETDENDVTYFLLYQLKIILRAIEALHQYLSHKASEIRETEELIRRTRALRDRLNHRQLALIDHAMKNDHTQYTVASHRHAHNISYETARSDLLKLAELKLLEQRRLGRAFTFVPPRDLRERLERWSPRATTRQDTRVHRSGSRR